MSRKDETPVDQSWMGEDLIAEMEGYMAFTNPEHPESYREGFRTALAVIEWPKVKSEHMRVVRELQKKYDDLLSTISEEKLLATTDDLKSRLAAAEKVIEIYSSGDFWSEDNPNGNAYDDCGKKAREYLSKGEVKNGKG